MTAAAVQNQKPVHPLRVRDFRLLWIGESISLIGDQFYLIALPWLVLQLTGNALALGVIIPILPKLIESFVDNDTANAARIYGLFGTAWAVMQFFFSPVLGSLSDRFGRRPVVLLSNFGLALDYVVMALASSLTWLFIGRLISGITSASISTAFAYIADITAPEKRAAVFGKIGVAFGAGFIFGPALGGVLGDIDVRLPFWVAAAFSFANTLYGLFILPESLPKERRSAWHWKSANPVGALRRPASQYARAGEHRRLPGRVGGRRRPHRRRHGPRAPGAAHRRRSARRLPRPPLAPEHLLPVLQPAAPAEPGRRHPVHDCRLRRPHGPRRSLG